MITFVLILATNFVEMFPMGFNVFSVVFLDSIFVLFSVSFVVLPHSFIVEGSIVPCIHLTIFPFLARVIKVIVYSVNIRHFLMLSEKKTIK